MFIMLFYETNTTYNTYNQEIYIGRTVKFFYSSSLSKMHLEKGVIQLIFGILACHVKHDTLHLVSISQQLCSENSRKYLPTFLHIRFFLFSIRRLILNSLIIYVHFSEESPLNSTIHRTRITVSIFIEIKKKRISTIY